MKERIENQNPNQVSILNLAFMGDSVFSLLVREYLINKSSQKVGSLHAESVKYVNASKQAEFIDVLLPHLTDEETAIYKRGRNAHTGNSSKASTVAEYHKATGLEALFGYLYLKGDDDRIRELFNIIFK
jgi:ribonuclease-3 family protein